MARLVKLKMSTQRYKSATDNKVISNPTYLLVFHPYAAPRRQYPLSWDTSLPLVELKTLVLKLHSGSNIVDDDVNTNFTMHDRFTNGTYIADNNSVCLNVRLIFDPGDSIILN